MHSRKSYSNILPTTNNEYHYTVITTNDINLYTHHTWAPTCTIHLLDFDLPLHIAMTTQTAKCCLLAKSSGIQRSNLIKDIVGAIYPDQRKATGE